MFPFDDVIMVGAYHSSINIWWCSISKWQVVILIKHILSVYIRWLFYINSATHIATSHSHCFILLGRKWQISEKQAPSDLLHPYIDNKHHWIWQIASEWHIYAETYVSRTGLWQWSVDIRRRCNTSNVKHSMLHCQYINWFIHFKDYILSVFYKMPLPSQLLIFHSR